MPPPASSDRFYEMACVPSGLAVTPSVPREYPVSAPSAPPGRTAPPSCQRRRRPLARRAGGRGRDRGAAAVRRSAADRRLPEEAIGSKDRCHFAPRLERELSPPGQTAVAGRTGSNGERRRLSWCSALLRACNGPSTVLQTLAAVTVAEPPIGVSAGSSLILSLSSGPGPARPAEAGGGTALDPLPCRHLPFASTCGCPTASPTDTPTTSTVHAMQRSVIVTRRIRCAACKEAATPNKLCVAIYGTGSLHLRRSRSYCAQTDLPVWTGSQYCHTLVPVATTTAVSRL